MEHITNNHNAAPDQGRWRGGARSEMAGQGKEIKQPLAGVAMQAIATIQHRHPLAAGLQVPGQAGGHTGAAVAHHQQVGPHGHVGACCARAGSLPCSGSSTPVKSSAHQPRGAWRPIQNCCGCGCSARKTRWPPGALAGLAVCARQPWVRLENAGPTQAPRRSHPGKRPPDPARGDGSSRSRHCCCRHLSS
jgi:hypothetical protein